MRYSQHRRLNVDGPIAVAFAEDTLYVSTFDGVLVDESAGPRSIYTMHDQGYFLTSTLDHQFLLASDGYRVAMIDRATEEVVCSWRSAGGAAVEISPAPDNQHVLVIGDDEAGTLKRFEFGRPRARKTWGSIRYGHIVWLNESQFLSLSVHGKTYISVHDAELTTEDTLGQLDFRTDSSVLLDGELLTTSPEGIARVAFTRPPTTETWWQGPPAELITKLPDDSVLVGTRDGLFKVTSDDESKIAEGHILRIAAGTSRIAWITSMGEEDVAFVA